MDWPLKAAAAPRPLIDAMALRLERPHIHVIVPGHNGSELRRQTLLENMRSLTKASLDITCTLYAYAPVQDVSPCVTVNHVGFWMQHLHGDEAVKLHRIYAADYVMIMIDSVALRSVDVRQLTLVMAWNCIDMAGPSCPSCESKQLIAPDSRYNTSHRSGRRVAFIDHQITLLTPAAFACQRRLAHVIGLDIDVRGWSIGKYTPVYCNLRVGIFDEGYVDKIASGAYGWDLASRDYIAGQTWLLQRMAEIKKPNVDTILGPLERPPPIETLSHREVQPVEQCLNARRAIVDAAPACFPCSDVLSRLDENETVAA